MLVAAIFVSMYGVSTVASQLDSVAFLSDKLPPGMISGHFSSKARLLRLCSRIWLS